MFVIVHEEFVLWKHHEQSSSSKMSSRMDMVTQLVGLAQAWEGLPWLFPALCLAVGGVLGRYVIPWSSDGMADELAGLVGRKMGRRYRTLAVNAGTNFPELLLMGYALLIGHWGGIGNPLGSNLANIYLVLLIAPLWIAVTGPSGGFGRLKSEFRLVKKHVIAALILWLFATIAMRSLASDGEGQLQAANAGVSLALCAVGFIGFLFWARRDRRRNPEVYEGDDGFSSAGDFKRLLRMLLVLGISSAAINWIFLAVSELYSDSLSQLFGVRTFAYLHYFVGSLVTSLPELTVATRALRRDTTPSANLALAGASVSNATNLGIAMLGILLALLFQISGE